MLKNSTQPILLQKLFELLEAHRSAFWQERTYWRAVGMVLGEIFNFGRHTVTQGLMALGLTDGDWSGFGVCEKQCGNPRSTNASVQWSVWVYALLLLSAYRAWRLLNAPPIPTRWWQGAKRWSFHTLWRQYRLTFWRTPPFQAFWTRTPNNWLKEEAFLIALANSVAASTRI